jgi:hypothetical protein
MVEFEADSVKGYLFCSAISEACHRFLLQGLARAELGPAATARVSV